MTHAQSARIGRWLLTSLALGLALTVARAEIGQIKTAKGQVSVERKG